VVFGLDPRANEGLARAFAERLAEKKYLALTAPPREPVSARFRVSAAIGPGTEGQAAVRVAGPGARAAETDVIVREELDGACCGGEAAHRPPPPGPRPPTPTFRFGDGLRPWDPASAAADVPMPAPALPRPVTGPSRFDSSSPSRRLHAAVLAEHKRYRS
jgi:hypothetical protein